MANYDTSHKTGENNKCSNSNRLTREKYSEKYINNIISSSAEEKRKKENEKKYGNGKYIYEGIIARIFGEYLIDLSKLSELDKNSFEYGYYEAANTQIDIMIEKRIFSDYIKSALNRKTKLKEDESIGLKINEVLYQIGYRDSHDNNPRIKEVSNIIKNNEDYMDGFEQGLHESHKKGR